MSDDFVVIGGGAGTGRVTALKAIHDSYVTAGYRVVSMTCLNAVQQELHRRGFRHPTTLPAELKRIVTGLTQWDDRTVLIVEGAAAARNYLTTLMGHASATGAKLIFAGDHDQLVKREIGFSGELFCRSPRSAPVAPPAEACFLLDLLLANADRITIPGDLEEEFTVSILPKYGARRASFWFWTQTVRTIATRNPICRWILVGGFLRIAEWVFRKTGG
jgi:hypothetical protein